MYKTLKQIKKNFPSEFFFDKRQGTVKKVSRVYGNMSFFRPNKGLYNNFKEVDISQSSLFYVYVERRLRQMRKRLERLHVSAMSIRCMRVPLKGWQPAVLRHGESANLLGEIVDTAVIFPKSA